LPPQPDAAAEFAIPEPAPEAWEALGRRTVWESDGRTLRFAIFHTGQKRRGIGINAGELFACGRDTALIVGRPPPLQRSNVARKVFETGTNEFHRVSRLTRRKISHSNSGNKHGNFVPWSLAHRFVRLLAYLKAVFL
jgi:hypothetical protein